MDGLRAFGLVDSGGISTMSIKYLRSGPDPTSTRPTRFTTGDIGKDHLSSLAGVLAEPLTKDEAGDE